MVIVRQKVRTITSLILFILICGIAASYGVSHYLRGLSLQWYDYLFLFLCLPVSSALFLRIIWNYKKVYLGKGKVRITYPSRFREYSYSLREVLEWTENKVKTPTGVYKELEISFADGKRVDISMQEHVGYAEARSYLIKKCKKKYNSAK